MYAHVGAQVTAGVEAAVADDAAHATGGGERGSRGGVAHVEIICGERIELGQRTEAKRSGALKNRCLMEF